MITSRTGRPTGTTSTPAERAPFGVENFHIPCFAVTYTSVASRGGARVDESLKTLSRYGWVDRERGVAQIPIERAMQWLADDAKRGVLHSPDPATTPDAGATARAR